MTAKSSNRANQTDVQVTPQPVQGVLQRKCACGQHTLGKSCSACSKDDESVLKRSVNKHGGASQHVPQIVHDVLRSPGTPLDNHARAFMEPRFGRDFSDVRIHTDSLAAQSAGAVGALAYTLGKDIVFGSGNYSPHTREGKSLLAHELTHVAQNRSLQRKHSAGISIGPENDHYETEADRNAHAVARGDSDPMRVGASSGEPGRLSRATMAVGSTNVDINYSNVVHVKVADYESEIETRFTSWTTSPATVIHTELTALSSAAKEWVLFALDLLVDNPVTGLNKVDAVKRLIAYAPSAKYRAVGNPDNNFENEALSVSGWFEKALTSGLAKPTGVKASFVQQRLSTGSGGGSTCPSPRTNALDAAKLKSDMPVELEAYLKTVQVISNTKNQPMAPLQKLGDAVQERARSYYSPYADHSRGRGNTFVQQWQYSAHMVSSQSAAGTPTTELRVAYLDSRARIVGDKGLFTTVNFDSSCDADNNELEAIVTTMETKSNIQALIDPILRQKSYTNQNVTPKQVIINPQVSTQTDDCEARWKTVRTICHELMHVMVHDDFRAAEKGRMIMREGWPEVLGHYLYEDITGDAAMKPKMEDGLANKPCASIPGSTIGYGDAGKKAEEIRIAIKNPNFRAAFFLGQLELAGIQPKLSVGTSTDPLEHEADRIADRAVSPSSEASVAPHINSYRGPAATDLEAPAGVSHVLSGSGRPLEPAVRRDMETRLGRDFSRVRVHSDATAAQSARTINAEAYTAGHNIVFGPGKFAPSTHNGRRLLAHELVHVVQQSGTGLVQRKSSPKGLPPSPDQDPYEVEANRRSDQDVLIDEILARSGSESMSYADSQKLVGVSAESPNSRPYTGPTSVPAEPSPPPPPPPVKVEAPPREIPESEIEAGVKTTGSYSLGGSHLSDPELEHTGAGKVEAEVGVPGRASVAGSVSGKGVRPVGPEEAPETSRTWQFGLEGKVPLAQLIFGSKRLAQIAPFIAFKELSLGVSVSSKRQHEENLRRMFRTKAFEFSLHFIGATFDEKKVKGGSVSGELGLSLVGGVESEQEVQQGRDVGTPKRTSKIGGKGAFGFKFFPRRGPVFISIEATIEVKGNKQGGVWFGTFEFTPLLGVGVNIGKLVEKRR